jgi:hypothetical protein
MQNRWDPAEWKEVTRGVSYSESEARSAAKKAIGKIREEKTRKETVYYDRRRKMPGTERIQGVSGLARRGRPVRRLGRLFGW